MSKKISIGTIDKIIKESPNRSDIVVDWHGEALVVRVNVSVEDILYIVSVVCNSCFDEDGVYMPELKDFSFRVGVISKLTNLAIPSSYKKKFEMVYSTDVYDEVAKCFYNCGSKFIEDVYEIANDKLEYMKRINEKKFDKKMKEFYGCVDLLSGVLSSVSSEVDSGELSNAIKLFSNGDINEESIIKACVSKSVTNDG